MKVSDAVKNRKSIRAFTDKSVDSELLKTILSISSRSPSGGNLQPWKIFVLNNQSMKKFKTFQKKWAEPESAAYDIYPKNLKEPYLSHSKKVGEQLYGSIGIARDDKEARWNQMFKNFEFFGAPAGLFCFVDRQMGLPQWSDLGMFLQTFMLVAQEYGLDTCAQEAWCMKQESVSAFLKVEPEYMIFCGMAIGYGDSNSPINSFTTERQPLEDWCQFV